MFMEKMFFYFIKYDEEKLLASERGRATKNEFHFYFIFCQKNSVACASEKNL
jgi:hypothetical protein